MSSSRTSIPRAPLIYGLLGLIPFLAPPLVAAGRPEVAKVALDILIAYAALILSFLGGARWGFALSAPKPNRLQISLSMLPTLVGLAILGSPLGGCKLQIIALAFALLVQGFWDVRASDGPDWYPRLRIVLTLGAIIGLALGASVARG
jgi:hypothetical protein